MVLPYLLAEIAQVSLVCDGTGIMNIMLVWVPWRTREIGLRMAVGFSGAIGVCFGFYPAGTASRLTPIGALRNEWR